MPIHHTAVCSACAAETRVPGMIGSGTWRRDLPPGWALVTICSAGFDIVAHWCPSCLAVARERLTARAAEVDA